MFWGFLIFFWKIRFSAQKSGSRQPLYRNTGARFQKRSDHCEKVIGSLYYNFSSAHDFSIRSDSTNDPASIGSWSWAILLATWIGVRSENIITTIGHFISNITTVKVHKLPGNTYWNMVCLVSTVCIFSMTLFTYTYLSNMACPKRVASWPNTVCGHWTGHDALVSALMNDVATPPIVTSWIDIISLTFFIQSWPRNFNSKFPSEWFMSWFNWQ